MNLGIFQSNKKPFKNAGTLGVASEAIIFDDPCISGQGELVSTEEKK